jgi:Undecaprenyl-phosphate galactose phosphotransferase WbaP
MSTASLRAGGHRDVPLTPGSAVASRARTRGRVTQHYSVQVALTSLPLIAADVLALTIAACCAAAAVGAFATGFDINLLRVIPPLTVAFLLVNSLLGLYPAVGLNPVVEFRQACVAPTLLFAVLGATLFFRSHATGDNFFFFGTWCLSLVLTPALRSVARTLAGRCRWWGQPAIVFGSGPAALEICKSLESNRGLGLRPVGLVEDAYSYPTTPAVDAARVSPQQASVAVRRHGVFWAIVAMPEASRENVLRVMEEVFLERYPRLLIIPKMKPLPSLWNRAHDCGGMPGIRVEHSLLLPLPRMVKRAMDLSIATVGGLLVLPLTGLICLLIKISSPGPIFYSQRRIGVSGRHFHAWKFRTMAANADQVLEHYLRANPHLQDEWQRDHKLKNDPRVTRIGRWLRKLSFDELPQIWNVLRGEMSLVGPRPIVDDEVEKYGETFRRYAKVVPGITGLWQISGRNNTTYDERVDFDSYYVRNWSPWLDIYILIRTVKVVLFREGAY